eukprot:TRINITY_DN1509_c0_g1_i1.p1 TRINITY_DN1509_c0_g1~~TRINITY_DN1509_c0_g1_i1.p1  ORF type:complete len:338 (-),score=28.38 TRINITY_DN1509_c0_g1_i1:64-1077(-)
MSYVVLVLLNLIALSTACILTYNVTSVDTCDGIARQYVMPKVALLAINPTLNCSSLVAGTTVCVATNGGWGNWSNCSASCGTGVRTRVCDNPPTIYGTPCDGPTQEVCDTGVLCGVPTTTDAPTTQVVCLPSNCPSRTCNNVTCEDNACKYTLQADGTPCIHTDFNNIVTTGACYSGTCQLNQTADPPTDCVWSEWTTSSQCTRSCGSGVLVRGRHILVKEQNGGKPCSGQTTDLIACNVFSCDNSTTTEESALSFLYNLNSLLMVYVAIGCGLGLLLVVSCVVVAVIRIKKSAEPIVAVKEKWQPLEEEESSDDSSEDVEDDDEEGIGLSESNARN